MFKYNPLKKDASVLIFDLDETLIQNHAFYNDTQIAMPTKKNNFEFTAKELSTPLTAQRFPQHAVAFLNSKKSSMIHLRPHLQEFMSFCFEHFNVAFWSNGGIAYVKNIVLQLLRNFKKSPKEIAFAWARTNKQIDRDTPAYVDVFTNAVVPYAKHQRHSYEYYKDMGFVFNAFPKTDKKYFILFDNLPTHKISNPAANVVFMPPFSRYNINDTVLLKLIRRWKQFFKPQLDAHQKTAGAAAAAAAAAHTAKPAQTRTVLKKTKTKTIKTKKKRPATQLHTQMDTLIETDGTGGVVPHPPLLLYLPYEELLWLEKESPTDDNVIYPNGYINSRYGKTYNHTPRTLFVKNENVVVPSPTKDFHIVAKIKKVTDTHIVVTCDLNRTTYKNGKDDVKRVKHKYSVPLRNAIHHSFAYAYI